MTDAMFIDKKMISETETDYDKLFKSGLELLQKYSGDVWTDYNIHDPGVAILEQLCYALTELQYKSSFDVENYFIDKNNEIPFEKLGLLRPQECIPNACITINDFRKYLFDEVQEIGNVWIEVDEENIAGLYKIYVDIADHIQLTEDLKHRIRNKIKKAFVKKRNLAEDISEIIILDREFMELCGEIEVRTTRPINEVYGEIFYTCSTYVASNIAYRSVKELREAGLTLPQILEGPLLKNGIILERDLFDRSRIIELSEMISRIKKIDGVEDVHSLYLQYNGKEIYEEIPYCENRIVKAINIPVDNKEIELKLTSNGKWYKANTSIVRDEVYKKLVYDPCFPEYIKDLQNIFDYPKCVYRDFNNYYSIQNDFPVSYGISYEGLSKNETPERKAKAKQLKAYLYFFEQIMGDYLESIQNIKRLLSTDEYVKTTYYSKFLDNSNIPDIEELYTDKAAMADNLKSVLARYDRSESRRSEVLDFLLSMYGLEFKQHSLRHYIKAEKNCTLEEMIIKNKIRYLTNAGLLTERSCKGINYLDEEQKSKNMSGIELQIMLRTGIEPADSNVIEKGLLIEHILLRPSENDSKSSYSEFYQYRVTAVFPGFLGRYSNKQFRMLITEIVEKYSPAHICVNCLWCEESDWKTIKPVYDKWRESLKKESVDREKLARELKGLLRVKSEE